MYFLDQKLPIFFELTRFPEHFMLFCNKIAFLLLHRNMKTEFMTAGDAFFCFFEANEEVLDVRQMIYSVFVLIMFQMKSVTREVTASHPLAWHLEICFLQIKRQETERKHFSGNASAFFFVLRKNFSNYYGRRIKIYNEQ